MKSPNEDKTFNPGDHDNVTSVTQLCVSDSDVNSNRTRRPFKMVILDIRVSEFPVVVVCLH